MDGRPTVEPDDLLPALDEGRVGGEIVLRVLREVRATVGERGRAA